LTKQEKRKDVPMTFTKQQSDMVAISSKELDTLISTAIKKIGGKKENDLCRYLPMGSGGYMHHFTLRKMKHQLPEKLSEMIKTFIVEADRPVTVAPKQRAARGSRKKRDQIVLTKSDIEHILSLARSVGDKEVVRKLSQKRDLRTIKRELISSIRHGRVEQELWDSYNEAILHSAI
jgi:hypothetical protein